jgi:hypothetical protein
MTCEQADRTSLASHKATQDKPAALGPSFTLGFGGPVSCNFSFDLKEYECLVTI